MKLLLTIITVFYSFLSYSQTTEEEYLYVTYGYKEQLLKGLDDKKGYAWKPITVFKFTNESGTLIWKKSIISKFEFEGLYRMGEASPCAVVTIYKENEYMKKKDGKFICIPHSKSGQDVIAKAKKYFEEEIKFEKSILMHYCLGLSELAIILAQQK